MSTQLAEKASTDTGIVTYDFNRLTFERYCTPVFFYCTDGDHACGSDEDRR